MSSQGREIPALSVEAKDFIRKLLAKNARKRMSLDNLLRHPWMVNNAKVQLASDTEDGNIALQSRSLTPQSQKIPSSAVIATPSDQWKSYLLPSVLAHGEE